MKRMKYRNTFALILCMLFAWTICLTALAEETTGSRETAPEETADAEANDFSAETIRHSLWGFMSRWAEGETDRLYRMCFSGWKDGNEDPAKALDKILETGKPYGYKVNSISGEDGDDIRTVSVTLQRETGDGGYAFSLYEITFLLEEGDGYYALDPDGFGKQGIPAEPVPEEEMILLTKEGIIRSCLEFHWAEGLYEKLAPVHKTVSKQGFRMEVISGLAEGKEVSLLVSLQDEEGKYDGNNFEPYFATNMDGSYSQGWMRLYHDEAEHRDYYLFQQELYRRIQPENRSVRFEVSEVRINEDQTVDLLPLLKEYGKTEEGVRHPVLEEHGWNREESGVPADEKVLDYHQPLDFPLFREIYLTGIGWIDHRLHVQTQNKGRDYIEMNHGRGSACSVWVEAAVRGKSYSETTVDYSPLNWDGDNSGWSEWNEFIFNSSPEEMNRLELDAEISVTTEILEGPWEVQVPLDLIYIATDPEPGETEPDYTQDETAGDTQNEDAAWEPETELSFLNDYTQFRLWEFFCRWAQADTDNLPESFTEETRNDGQAAKAFMDSLLAYGTPLEYQISSVSGRDGDAVRKYTCTVLMDPETGESPRYQRHVIGMKNDGWWYSVDPDSTAFTGAAETDPDRKTFSLSTEAVISDYLDYFDPGVREQLCPIGLSCESSGIRMEVISGYAEENQAWFVYSLQDAEGKYDGFSCDVFDMVDNLGTLDTFSTATICRDQKEHKVFLLWNPHYKEPIQAEDRTVTLSLEYLFFTRNTWADLAPLLEQYGEKAGTIQVPEDIRDGDYNIPENREELKVLDYTHPLDVSLLDNTLITGIGWIDGKLHVQVHLTDLISWSARISASLSGETGSEDVKELSYSPLEWYTEEGEWIEYVLDCKPEDQDRLSLAFSATVGQQYVSGMWKAEFPLSTICAGNE